MPHVEDGELAPRISLHPIESIKDLQPARDLYGRERLFISLLRMGCIGLVLKPACSGQKYSARQRAYIQRGKSFSLMKKGGQRVLQLRPQGVSLALREKTAELERKTLAGKW